MAILADTGRYQWVVSGISSQTTVFLPQHATSFLLAHIFIAAVYSRQYKCHYYKEYDDMNRNVWCLTRNTITKCSVDGIIDQQQRCK